METMVSGKAYVEGSPRGDLKQVSGCAQNASQDHYLGIRRIVDADNGVTYDPPTLAVVSFLWLRQRRTAACLLGPS